MTYVVIRLLAGSSQQNRSQEELIEVAVQELAPQLKQAGCQRYNLIKFDDGRMGSVSRFENRETAERASKVAQDWIQNTRGMQGYSVEQSLGGEVIFAYGDAARSFDGAYGSVRIFANAAGSVNDVAKLLERLATPALQSAGDDVLRYTAIKLDSGGYAFLTATRTRDANDRLSQQSRQARTDEQARRLIGGQPSQSIDGQIIRSIV